MAAVEEDTNCEVDKDHKDTDDDDGDGDGDGISSKTITTKTKYTNKNNRKPQNARWMELYQRLLVYKKEHDDSTKVPQNYKKDPQLGHWVKTRGNQTRTTNYWMTAILF